MKNKTSTTILAFSLVFLIIGAWFFTNSKKTDPNSHYNNSNIVKIDGYIDLDGVSLAEGQVVLMYKKIEDKDFKVSDSKIAISDGALWKIENLKAGKAYEIQAHIELNGKKSDFTQVQTIVASAHDVKIEIDNTHQPEKPKQVAISGNFDLNGYFPEGSKLLIYYSELDQDQKSIWKSADKFVAQDKGEWSFKKALEGKKYEFKAELIDKSDKVLIKSEKIEALAPAQKEIIKLDSNLKPPKAQISEVEIKGNFKFNGPLSNDSKVSLGIRKAGEAKFQDVFHGLNAKQDLAWSFDKAYPGQKYEIQGYLWAGEKPFSESQILTVVAPANHEILKIQAQIPPERPKAGTIKATCLKNKDDVYQVKIEFNTKKNLEHAQQYRLEMGYSADGNDLLKTVITPSNPKDQQQFTTNYILPKENVAYIRYATSTCRNCNTFSEDSPAIQISCH
jgi:hypothetical protein